jgi:hypothetical protein
MPRFARACFLCLISTTTLIGCGGGPTLSDSGPPPPHGGNLVRLPANAGYVEVVKKANSSAKTPMAGEVSFYFLKDASTPISPAPSAGTLTVGKKKVALKSEGDALVTPEGPPLFPKGDVDGILTVELDGKSVNIPMGVR